MSFAITNKDCDMDLWLCITQGMCFLHIVTIVQQCFSTKV